MGSFFDGVKPPAGEPECSFGRSGWLGRALRDAPRYVVSEFWAAVVLLLAVGVVTTVFLVVPPSSTHGLVQRVAFAVTGVVLGVVIGVGLVGLAALTVWGRRRHWKAKTGGGFSQDPSHYGNHGFAPNHTGFWIGSEHWHTVRNLQCIVTDPLGQEWRSPSWTSRSGGVTAMVAAHGTGGGFSYPSDFGAPWPMPGDYLVRWEMDRERATKPLVIARGTWSVTG